ncbi:long chain fatty alcohol oxidase [Leucosporidium creatinivorum]|uniref:Long-chain-alcohol oxidase n=1 Tax=Leucosporidium creatinivorum TaxID=106004 RepID=A0A1Y2G2W1_9BASI|nr:long chain fatty alcohol oxidase [Leucosporidium creatinivorum]
MASPFSEAQLKVLASACDAAFQATTVDEILPPNASQEQRERVKKLAETKFSDLPGAVDALAEQYVRSLSPPKLAELGKALSLLSTRAGTFLLTGHGSPFPSLTVEQREAAISSWSTSRFALFRSMYRGIVAVAMYKVYTDFPEMLHGTGFPTNGDPLRYADPARNRLHHDYKFEKVVQDYQYIETDVLVVGSGAGGGVVASEMAEKGWSTLVVEKGVYLKPEEMVGTPKEGFEKLYEAQGLMATEDGGLNVLAGSSFGGGTVINWSASLRPQHFLREQWAKQHDLPHFLSAEFANSIDFVCNRMGVSADHIKHNKANSRLVNASVKLGYPVATIPQNTAGHAHECGHCAFGCLYSEKQSGPVCWLRHAASAGAKFLVEAEVERLLFARSSTSRSPTADTLRDFYPTSSRKVCIGALVRTKDGKGAILRAKRSVVLSAGTINSPGVLLRSGLKNPRIGKNLRLHPVTGVTGFYDEDITPWEGSIMTAVSTVQENIDGSHHGVKIEVIQSAPCLFGASSTKWISSKEHKRAMVKFGNSFTLISIARDRGSGSVFLDENGTPRMDYSLDPYDGASLLRGIIASSELHLVSGANRISTTQIGVEDYIPAPGHKSLSDPRWKEWVAKVEKAGVWSGKCNIGSAHQMGSCQMSAKATQGVVDPRGQVWGTENLWIADASIFPTASAVNPMITNMALSHSIAQFIDEDVRTKLRSPVEAHL